MRTVNSFLLVLLAFSITLSTLAQEKKTIRGEFTDQPFNDFVSALEQKTDYKFFFDPAQTDSLSITISFSNKTLTEVLDEVFRNSDYRYSLDANHYVYVTLREPILTELPSNFFSGDKLPDSVSQRKENARFEEAEKVKVEKLTIIGNRGSTNKSTATLAGYIRSMKTGEPVIGASVLIEKPLIGVATDANGYYSITLPKGTQQLRIRSIGMKSIDRNILLHSDGKMNVEMDEDVRPLKEVIVESEKDERVLGLQMGLEKIDIKTLKQIPVALGEVDILKAVLILPGVQSVGEATVGFNVRGGATDQNLILFNDATIYNPSHLFGFFSAFNADLIKNVELYKSGIPAEHGGRISSLLDISTREGNKRKWAGSGGISPITGRFALEGPIIKDKTSFLIGGRSTYSDWLLKQIPSSNFQNSKASFYDLNLAITHEINSKNNLYLSGYISSDRFRLQNDTTYSYRNKAASLKWRHIFTNKLLGTLTTSYSGYEYTIASSNNPVNAFNLSYTIDQLNAKADFNYFLSSRHTIGFGAGTIRYKLAPGSLKPNGQESLVVPNVLQNEQAYESSVYVGDNFEVTPQLSIYGGLRYSFFQNIGPRDVFVYQPGTPKDVSTIIDTVSFSSGKKISNSGGPEIRLSARYSVSGNTSVKLSYNRLRQYIQMLSNTTAIAPTDIWKLSDPYIKPLIGDQISLGYYHSLTKSIEFSVEAYYKIMHNFLDYKGGAELILNHHIETDVLNADGKAYGIELLVKKTSGKINGWLSYTYSRSLLKTAGATSIETINRGEYYSSNYDKPHAVNFIGNYKFNRRFSMSLNMVYSTGRPITLPIAKYNLDGSGRLLYSDRNQYRIPDYFRSDFSLNIEGNHKIKKLAHSSWSVSVYNLTGRRNAYSVYFTAENGVVKGYKLSIFGSAIPTITYNFKF
ncbi:MAG: TonB-dependent receptor [Cyclobacteriaceae bacterium]|nr:TonB-dependent receptor [Cyclobacteriaceae bacterium]